MRTSDWTLRGGSPFFSERARSRAPQIVFYAAAAGAAMLVSPSGDGVRQRGRRLRSRPRTYRETLDAWRTSCPRLPVWEDAIDAGLVEVVREGEGELSVAVTAEGARFLRGARAHTPNP